MLLPITAPEAINMPCGVHNALERYSGPYVGLLHNVRCVSWADIVLASDTRTTPVEAELDFTHIIAHYLAAITINHNIFYLVRLAT